MVTDIKEYKFKKISKELYKLSESTKQGGIQFAEACYAISYKVREYESKLKANEKELDKRRDK